jgi:hypothetical protein
VDKLFFITQSHAYGKRCRPQSGICITMSATCKPRLTTTVPIPGSHAQQAALESLWEPQFSTHTTRCHPESGKDRHAQNLQAHVHHEENQISHPLPACLAPCLSLGFSASRSFPTAKTQRRSQGNTLATEVVDKPQPSAPTFQVYAPRPAGFRHTTRSQRHPWTFSWIHLTLPQHGQKSSLVVRVTVAVSTAPTTPRS